MDNVSNEWPAGDDHGEGGEDYGEGGRDNDDGQGREPEEVEVEDQEDREQAEGAQIVRYDIRSDGLESNYNANNRWQRCHSIPDPPGNSQLIIIILEKGHI